MSRSLGNSRPSSGQASHVQVKPVFIPAMLAGKVSGPAHRLLVHLLVLALEQPKARRWIAFLISLNAQRCEELQQREAGPLPGALDLADRQQRRHFDVEPRGMGRDRAPRRVVEHPIGYPVGAGALDDEASAPPPVYDGPNSRSGLWNRLCHDRLPLNSVRSPVLQPAPSRSSAMTGSDTVGRCGATLAAPRAASYTLTRTELNAPKDI
jgi:hypothetical protein